MPERTLACVLIAITGPHDEFTKSEIVENHCVKELARIRISMNRVSVSGP